MTLFKQWIATKVGNPNNFKLFYYFDQLNMLGYSHYTDTLFKVVVIGRRGNGCGHLEV